MYQVAVCENNRHERENIYKLCNEILSESGFPFRVASFCGADELLCVLEESPSAFDLLILDIKMEPLSGMELARRLRAEGNRVSIIFATGYEEYLREGYDVQPIQYLLKPITKEALYKAINVDLQLNHMPKAIFLSYRNKSIFLETDQIIYLESQNHNVYIWMKDEVRSFRMSLRQIQESLPDSQFCRCHNSFIVNMAWIRHLSHSEILLKTGQALPVGRSYYRTLQSNLVRYLNRI